MLKYDSAQTTDKPRIVYSTCSLNPIENEAVVAAALSSSPGEKFPFLLRFSSLQSLKDFELVDVSDDLPSLVRKPGLSTWRPAVDRDINMSFVSYKEYCEYFDATFKNIQGSGGNSDAAESNGAEGPGANQKGKARTRGKERNKPIKNKMLPSQWPPDNAGELHLDRWCVLEGF